MEGQVMVILVISGVVLSLGALYGFALLVSDIVSLVEERRHARRRVAYQRATMSRLANRRSSYWQR